MFIVLEMWTTIQTKSTVNYRNIKCDCRTKCECQTLPNQFQHTKLHFFISSPIFSVWFCLCIEDLRSILLLKIFDTFKEYSKRNIHRDKNYCWFLLHCRRCVSNYMSCQRLCAYVLFVTSHRHFYVLYTVFIES